MFFDFFNLEKLKVAKKKSQKVLNPNQNLYQ